MPAPVVAAIITGAATAGTTIAASKMSSNTAKRAQASEDKYTAQALDAEREERDYQRRLTEDQLKREDEQRAYDRQQAKEAIGRQLEQRDYDRGQYASYVGRLAPFRQTGLSSLGRLNAGLGANLSASVPTAVAGRLVTLRAPNGETRQVPSSQVDYYTARGAVVL